MVNNKFNNYPQNNYDFEQLEKELLVNEPEEKTAMISERQIEAEKRSLVVNAFGGPGAGKTTSCYEITAELKKMGYVAEYVPEYAKELVYDKNWELLDGSLENQEKMLKEQIHRIDRLHGQVDFIVTDAPLLMNITYCRQEQITEAYKNTVLSKFREYDNFNVFIKRDTTQGFEEKGRIHNFEESIQKDSDIKELLKENDLFYGQYEHDSAKKIAENMVATYERLNHITEEKAQTQDTYKGFAYVKGDKHSTIICGSSEQQILSKLQGYNIARQAQNQFAYCNIGSYDAKNDRYEEYHNFDVATGKDITPIRLSLPKMEKEEFEKTVQYLKENGATFQRETKGWYIPVDMPKNKFSAFLPGYYLGVESEQIHKIVMDMDDLGYEYVQVDGFSDDFIMWQDKENAENGFGYDGWDAVKDFTERVSNLMNNYSVEELQNRANGDYTVFEYGTVEDMEVATALRNYPQQVQGSQDKIRKEFTKYGFEIDKKTAQKVEKLNKMTNKNHSVRDIAEAYKNRNYQQDNPEAQEVVNSIGKQLSQQEVSRESTELMIEA